MYSMSSWGIESLELPGTLLLTGDVVGGILRLTGVVAGGMLLTGVATGGMLLTGVATGGVLLLNSVVLGSTYLQQGSALSCVEEIQQRTVYQHQHQNRHRPSDVHQRAVQTIEGKREILGS